MADFNIKTGDTLPVIRAILRQGDGSVIDLADAAEVRFHMRRRGSTTLLIDKACDIPNPAGGIVQYAWQVGDFEDAGQYEAEFEITYTSGDVATVPNNKHLSIVITAEIA